MDDDKQQQLKEEELLVEAAQRDPEAFGALYERYLDAIFRYCVYRVHSREDAEDITAQIFMKALRALPRFQWQKVKFSAWLYRIAHNEVIDYYRKSKATIDIEEVAFKLEDDKPLPDEMVINKEERAAVWQHVRKLPQHYQEIITLKFNDEMNYREIGEVIGKSESAVKMLFFRCFRKLREQMQDNQQFVKEQFGEEQIR